MVVFVKGDANLFDAMLTDLCLTRLSDVCSEVWRLGAVVQYNTSQSLLLQQRRALILLSNV